MTVNACVAISIKFVRHSNGFLSNSVLMMPVNKTIEKTKRIAPGVKLAGVPARKGKKNPHIVGVRRRLWAMSDSPPVAIRTSFVYENRDMLCKRIAQKGLFFYHRYLHDRSVPGRLLSALKVTKSISDIIFLHERGSTQGSWPLSLTKRRNDDDHICYT